MASRSREYLKREEHLANIRRAQTECRSIAEDVCITGIGLRRIQLVHSPSFSDGCAWDVRQLSEQWFVYRSKIQEGTDSLIGYDRLLSPPDPLNRMFDRLCSIDIPIAPDLSGMVGLDGDSFELAICGDMFSSIRLKWWCDPPAQWQQIANAATDMIAYFKSLDVDSSFA
ncbi:MAG: hypothetical protein KDB03_28195 [Planctomycetales bacterium]|nr:hypothetical protein [Planctomycetales bacterium]